MKADPKKAAGRAFVRSLNILLKFARLYGYEHVRTIEQLQIAWQELRTAIPLGTDSGLVLGATNSQLLLDGVPLEGSPAEKQFAQLLSAAGVASVQFLASLTEEEIGRFVRAFPIGKAKPAELAQQLKVALAGAQGIRINEICFVATDARLKDASMAAQIAAASLGGDQDQFRQWLNDPEAARTDGGGAGVEKRWSFWARAARTSGRWRSSWGGRFRCGRTRRWWVRPSRRCRWRWDRRRRWA